MKLWTVNLLLVVLGPDWMDRSLRSAGCCNHFYKNQIHLQNCAFLNHIKLIFPAPNHLGFHFCQSSERDLPELILESAISDPDPLFIHRMATVFYGIRMIIKRYWYLILTF
jgi:hypothetical protein